MEKSKMMHGYEQETGKMSMMLVSQISGVTPSFPTEDYIAWLESKANISDDAIEIIRTQCDEISALKEKAEAYGRLISGSAKITMQEMANLIGRPITIGRDGGITAHGAMPRLETTQFGKFWHNEADDYMEINESFVDFSGSWEDSLTLPNGWEA